ncbi:MAG: PHP domain-containing protein, partial [Lentisphaerae bacterium]|nr:PHP domain-containing protein [Lentisphaerota bacterium]
GIKALSGVELSVEAQNKTVHMLAYGIDTENKSLNEALEYVRDGRSRRNASILSKLSVAGCHISMGEVMHFAGPDGVVGRPHIARALVKKGYASSVRDAFTKYLGRGAAAYSERMRLEPSEAIRLIHEAGGISVLAHPGLCGLGFKELGDFVGELAEFGLDGIEAYYPGHDSTQVEQYLGYAERFGLVVTGGTDFHGEMRPHVQIGAGHGTLNVKDELFDAILARQAEGTARRASDQWAVGRARQAGQ